MSNNSFSINSNTGLGSFTDLDRKYNIKNYVTYDNSIWGNMNPLFEVSSKRALEIEENDRKLSEIVKVKTSFVLTTPPEDTLMIMNKNSLDYLEAINKSDEYGYKYISIRTNGIIYEKSGLKDRIGFIVAPADCAVFIIAHPDWKGLILMHIGFPQVLQQLHLKLLSLFQANYPQIDLSKAEIFITPYINKDNYSISENQFNIVKESLSAKILKNYSEYKSHKVFECNRYFIDFVGIALKEIKEHFNMSNYKVSNICTYEEASKGNLFSHELTQEKKHLEEEIKEGTFNVVVSV